MPGEPALPEELTIEPMTDDDAHDVLAPMVWRDDLPDRAIDVLLHVAGDTAGIDGVATRPEARAPGTPGRGGGSPRFAVVAGFVRSSRRRTETAMLGYLKGHRIQRKGKAGAFWWTVEDGTERFASLDDAAEAIRAGRIRRAAHVGSPRRVRPTVGTCDRHRRGPRERGRARVHQPA